MNHICIGLNCSVLLWLTIGCSPQPEPQPKTTTVTPWTIADINSIWLQEYSRPQPSWASLGLQADKCRRQIHNLKGEINALSGRDQRSHWQELQANFHNLNIIYRQQLSSYYVLQKNADPNSPNAEEKKTKSELEALNTEYRGLEEAIRDKEATYTQARNHYEQQKRRYFEQFYQAALEQTPESKRFYRDQNVTLGITSIDFLPSHTLVTFEFYGSRACFPETQNIHKLFTLQDDQGHSQGFPEETSYDDLASVNGFILTMAYKRRPGANQRPSTLVLPPSCLPAQTSAIVLTCPNENSPRHFINTDLSHLNETSEEEEPSWDSERIIPCQRMGMHLNVPVTLDIHGIEVQTTMILDTGASITVLPISIYTRGIAKPLDSLPTIQATTANGIITSPVDRIQISTNAFSKTTPVALTNSPVALLGANYFSGHQITVDLEGQCITVHPN